MVRLKHIDKSFTRPVLSDISFDVRKGEVLGILGPSGCGKSTLFNIISGLERPDGGQVFLNGKDCTGQTGNISFMHQKDLLLPWKNLLDNVSVPLVLRKVPPKEARETARTYLDDFGLAGFEDHYPLELSGGMRQRAALLRTYLFTRDIMLLDEPFGALDAITRGRMQEWLLGFIKEHSLTVLFVTHDVDEAVMLADRVLVLSPAPAKIIADEDISAGVNGSKEYFLSLLNN